MSLARALRKKYRISFHDYWTWAKAAEKGKYKRLFDAYEKSLQDCELVEAKYQAFLMQDWKKAGFGEKQDEVWHRRGQGGRIGESWGGMMAIVPRIWISGMAVLLVLGIRIFYFQYRYFEALRTHQPELWERFRFDFSARNKFEPLKHIWHGTDSPASLNARRLMLRQSLVQIIYGLVLMVILFFVLAYVTVMNGWR